MNSQQQERHVLVINGLRGRQAIALDAAAYSVGRDLTNAVVLDFETVSRQHAILLRVPIPGTNEYRYRLIDGNADGKPSTNGTFVNGKRCSSQQLNHGDTILLGRKIKAAYLMVAMAENEFSNYLESIAYQSIKSQSLSPKETLVGADFSGELLADQLSKATKEIDSRPLVSVGLPSNTNPSLAATAEPVKLTTIGEKDTYPGDNFKETVPEIDSALSSPLSWRQILAGIVVVVAVAGGVGLFLNINSSPPESQPTQSSQ